MMRREGRLSHLPAADLYRCHGGIMRIKRAIGTNTIVALSMAGSILAGAAVPLAVASASVAPVAVVAAASPNVYYHT